jgi:hypothetical protein
VGTSELVITDCNLAGKVLTKAVNLAAFIVFKRGFTASGSLLAKKVLNPKILWDKE